MCFHPGDSVTQHHPLNPGNTFNELLIPSPATSYRRELHCQFFRRHHRHVWVHRRHLDRCDRPGLQCQCGRIPNRSNRQFIVSYRVGFGIGTLNPASHTIVDLNLGAKPGPRMCLGVTTLVSLFGGLNLERSRDFFDLLFSCRPAPRV